MIRLERVPTHVRTIRSTNVALFANLTHFSLTLYNILLFLPYVYICTQIHYIRHTTIIVQVSNASTYYANSRLKDTK